MASLDSAMETFGSEGEQGDSRTVVVRQKEHRTKQTELSEIYLENTRLREKISKNKADGDCSDNRDGDNREGDNRDRYNRDGDFTEVLVRLEQLQKDQEDIKGGINRKKTWRTTGKILLVIVVAACFITLTIVAVLPRNLASPELSSLDKASFSSALLQPLPVNQIISQSTESDGDTPEPMPKYYFNVGMRNDYLLQECQGPQLKRSFPDMDYALLGYNILKGYPLAIGHDPGFALPIFSADYRAGGQTADCRYSVPKGIILIPDVSCVTSFSSEVVETKYEFSKSLDVSASVSGGGWGVSFSASAGYKESSSEVSTGESVYILSRASCNYYYMRLLEDDAPPFHPVFLRWILKLNDSKHDSDYVEFFEKYGTHFLKEVKFGASFTFIHKMSSKSYKKEKESGVNVAVSASYSGIINVGGGFSLDSSQKESASNFQKKVETRTITIGAAPPANGDAMTWASTVKESPVPVTYDLASIEDLFTASFMENAQVSQYNINYTRIAEQIVKTKMKYCNVLKDQGLLDNCAELSAGLTLKNTRMHEHFDKTVLTSIGKCTDECFKRTNCAAITFCVHCRSSESDYNTCYMYDEILPKYAVKDEKWESMVITPEMEKQMVYDNTAVNGIERALDNSSSVTTLRQCFAECLDDLFCVAFSFCACPEKDKQCTLYSDGPISLFKEDGTSTHFISRHLSDVDSVYPTTTTRATTRATARATTRAAAKNIRNWK